MRYNVKQYNFKDHEDPSIKKHKNRKSNKNYKINKIFEDGSRKGKYIDKHRKEKKEKKHWSNERNLISK